jgi:hypothetical protein
VDDFQSSLAGWQSGALNATPPSLVANVGPKGAGDNAMQVTSSGGISAVRALVAFDTAQWAGNHASAGISSITLDLKNTGATELVMRLGFRGSDLTTWFVTNLGYDLAAGGAWQNVRFSLTEADVTLVAGTQSYATVLGNVTELRLLDNPAIDFRGASIDGTLLVDNITAVPEPVACATVLGLGAIATAAFLRRCRDTAEAVRGMLNVLQGYESVEENAFSTWPAD